MLVQVFSPAITAQAKARQSRTDGVAESVSMRRSVGMRESMCLFLQLEGAVEGQNGFEPEEVLQVCQLSLLLYTQSAMVCCIMLPACLHTKCV